MRTRLFAQALALLTVPAVGLAAFTSLTPNSAPRHLVLTAAGAAPVVGAPSTPPSGVVASRPLTQGGLIPSVAYAPGAYQLLDLYLPDRSGKQGLAPVIVYLHSGGGCGRPVEANDAAAARVARGSQSPASTISSRRRGRVVPRRGLRHQAGDPVPQGQRRHLGP